MTLTPLYKHKTITIVWSGGADSTLALASALLHAKALSDNGHVGDHEQVVALTLNHWQTNGGYTGIQMKQQMRAMTVFKAWARKRGLKFKHHTIRVHTKPDTGSGSELGQSGMFLCHLFPYFTSTDVWPNEVRFGYIRGDDFWHNNAEFRTAFDRLCRMSYQHTTLGFPLEWHYKHQVLLWLKKIGVPRNAWWTCDNPRDNGKACRKCLKCMQLKRADEDARDTLRKNARDQIEVRSVDTERKSRKTRKSASPKASRSSSPSVQKKPDPSAQKRRSSGARGLVYACAHRV